MVRERSGLEKENHFDNIGRATMMIAVLTVHVCTPRNGLDEVSSSLHNYTIFGRLVLLFTTFSILFFFHV